MFSEIERELLSYTLARYMLTPPTRSFPLKRSVRDPLISSSIKKLESYTALTVFTPREAEVMYDSVLSCSNTSIDFGEMFGDSLSIEVFDSMMEKLERLAGFR